MEEIPWNACSWNLSTPEIHHRISRLRLKDYSNRSHKILWEDPRDIKGAKIRFTGVPFIILGRKVFDCQHGKDRKAGEKRKREDAEEIQEDSKERRQTASRNLRKALEEGVTKYERRIYIDLPLITDHQNHFFGEVAGISQSLDEKIIKRIHKLVAEGVKEIYEMRRHLKIFVKEVLFRDDQPPQDTNRRYFPRTSDLRTHMYRATVKNRMSRIDQANGEQSRKLLFVHQTAWQKRLLRLYGNDICLLDATYKTTRYALPLFYLAVKTNVDYQVVGSFVTEDETVCSIKEALEVVREWNPDWSPHLFMTDNRSQEIQAIENLFPECKVLL